MASLLSRSPLAPLEQPVLPEIFGVQLSVGAAGIKYRGRCDVMLALLEPGTVLAGCYTKSKTRSAPVEWCAERTPCGEARAILVNSGNSNAFTGRLGDLAVKTVMEALAEEVGCSPGEVFMASTGVIGEPLDASKIVDILPQLLRDVRGDGWLSAVQATMTTDTFPKLATTQVVVGSKTVRINGFAKGSGMIAPDMATMLAFLFTDAEVPQGLLQTLLGRAVARTFNHTTVDGDTSTSDTVLCAATGKVALGFSEGMAWDEGDVYAFYQGLEVVCRDLAQQVVRDGEGASKFVTISVRGAEDDEAARRIGLSIGNSPLVKTAIAGEDANWGRIVMAVGKSGERADRDRLSIFIGGMCVARSGARSEEWDDAALTAHLRGREIVLEVDIGVGSGQAEVWTCDLTHGYIDINGSYRS